VCDWLSLSSELSPSLSATNSPSLSAEKRLFTVIDVIHVLLANKKKEEICEKNKKM